MTATTATHLRDHAIGQQTGSVLSSRRQHQLVHIVRAKKQALLGDVIEVTFIILCEANDASSNPMRQITHSHSSSKHKLCLQRRSKNHAGTKIHCRQRTVHCAKAAQQLHQANSDAPRVLSDANSGQNWPDWARNI